MEKIIDAGMIVEAFNKFSAVEFDREPMGVGKYFVVRTNADNIYRINTDMIKEIQCCAGGKDTRFEFKIEVYNRIKGFIMDFDCCIYAKGNPIVEDLSELVFQFEGIDTLF